MNEFNLLESSGITENGQKKNYRAIYSYGDYKVRIVVSLDTSYPRMQSCCKGEVWSTTELKWNALATMTAPEWTEPSYAVPGGTAMEDGTIMEAELALQSQIVTVLG